MATVEDDIVINCIRIVVVKTCGTAATLAKFACYRLFDLIGLVFNALAICTVLRAYPTINVLVQTKKTDFPLAWRLVGIAQLLIFFLLDIPTFVMLVFETIFFWRIYMLDQERWNWSYDHGTCKREKVGKMGIMEKWVDRSDWKQYGFIGLAFRRDVTEQFLGLLTDVFVIPFAIVVFCSWRCVKTYHALKEQKTDFKRKGTIIRQFLLVIVDFFVFLIFLFQCCTWRMPIMVEAVVRYWRSENTERAEWCLRNKIVINFLRLFLDFLMIPIVLLLLLSWRCPILIKKFRSYDIYNEAGKKIKSRGAEERRLRGGIMTHFGRYCIDLAMLIPIIVVFCSWRCPILFIKFGRFLKSKKKRGDENQLRKSLLFHFAQFLLDLISILPLLTTILTWRLVFFIKLFPLNPAKTTARKFKKVRLECWKNFFFFLLDIPVLFSFLFSCLFFWRVPEWLPAIRNACPTRKDDATGKVTHIWWDQRYQQKTRRSIMIVAGFSFLDIFALILAFIVVVTVWRAPHFIRLERMRVQNKKTKKSILQRYTVVTREFGMLFVDILMFILLLVILITMWRIPPMARKIIKHSKYEDPSI